MLSKIKTLLELIDTSKDALIDLLIDITIEEVKNYCNVKDVSNLESIIIQIVVFKYNRIGTEGLTSESFSGASYNYTNDYPQSIIKALNKHCKLRCI